jgi:hypothetical protein
MTHLKRLNLATLLDFFPASGRFCALLGGRGAGLPLLKVFYQFLCVLEIRKLQPLVPLGSAVLPAAQVLGLFASVREALLYEGFQLSFFLPIAVDRGDALGVDGPSVRVGVRDRSWLKVRYRDHVVNGVVWGQFQSEGSALTEY